MESLLRLIQPTRHQKTPPEMTITQANTNGIHPERSIHYYSAKRQHIAVLGEWLLLAQMRCRGIILEGSFLLRQSN
jgi:hypothetical protein